MTLPTTLIIFGVISDWHIPYSVAVEDIPDLKRFVFTVLFVAIAEDLILYFVHRTLHAAWLYPYIHKIHHRYINTVGISAEYSHPLEFFGMAILPNALIGLLLGKHLHITTMMMYNFARAFESHDGHCGYEFPWSPYRLIPFSTSAAYHDFHHSHNVGNYSSYLSFWDTVFGNNKDFNEY